jgi:hypothetical protein
MKIVDDDVDLKALNPDPAQGPTSLEELDEAPIVADFIDERPDHVKQLEAYRGSDRWKLMAKDKGKKIALAFKAKPAKPGVCWFMMGSVFCPDHHLGQQCSAPAGRPDHHGLSYHI